MSAPGSCGRCTIATVTKRHPLAALALALVPVIALVGGLPFVNRVEPTVLGLPFLLFWILAWVLATPLVLAVAYVVFDAEDDRTTERTGR